MLSKPVLAKRDNRNIVAPINTYCGDPEEWFQTDSFAKKKIHAASFDFFVDWSTEKICDEVWIKRISDSDDIYNKNEAELIEMISDHEGRDKARALNYFLRVNKMHEKYMLFRDVPEKEWETRNEKVVELDLSKYKKGSVSYADVVQLEEEIRNFRKIPASIGKAGLVYSTSSLEGYMSKRNYFWPGDVDTLLFDDANNVVALIEFKKHTSASKIPFENQGISNYGVKDKLKYKSLALLRDRFCSSLYVIYYPIPSNISYMILERIEGNPNNLWSKWKKKIKLPNIRSEIEMEEFSDNFLSAIKEEE